MLQIYSVGPSAVTGPPPCRQWIMWTVRQDRRCETGFKCMKTTWTTCPQVGCKNNKNKKTKQLFPLSTEMDPGAGSDGSHTGRRSSEPPGKDKDKDKGPRDHHRDHKIATFHNSAITAGGDGRKTAASTGKSYGSPHTPRFFGPLGRRQQSSSSSSSSSPDPATTRPGPAGPPAAENQVSLACCTKS